MSSTFEVQPRKNTGVALTCFVVVVLLALLLVGSGVEIAYYRDQTSTLNGIEEQRDQLRETNTRLREIVIAKLDEQTDILKEQNSVLQKQNDALDDLEKEVHRAK